MENFWKYIWQGLNTVGIILAFIFMSIVSDLNNQAYEKSNELEKEVEILEKQIEIQNEQIQFLKEQITLTTNKKSNITKIDK